ncbi:hypothetical protein BDN70DRAFT_295947 [Pholiota conissans]|uniref:Uncharacterized protein n=1 Tax=Pholiota conissans TaxID=109636 RepID=A0A9P6CW19_9AGAR|nr:hypothetical protein BDN70DRAFT_295947 [Pholiota conissans]
MPTAYSLPNFRLKYSFSPFAVHFRPFDCTDSSPIATLLVTSTHRGPTYQMTSTTLSAKHAHALCIVALSVHMPEGDRIINSAVLSSFWAHFFALHFLRWLRVLRTREKNRACDDYMRLHLYAHTLTVIISVAISPSISYRGYTT